MQGTARRMMAGLIAGLGMLGLVACGSPPARSHSGSGSGSSGKSPTTKPSRGGGSSGSITAPGIPWRIDALHFLTPDRGWLSVDANVGGTFRSAIYGTTDGGQHWTLLHLWSPASPPPWAPNGNLAGAFPVFRLTFSSPNDGWGVVNLGVGACQAMFGILHTTDGGRHWTQAGSVQGSDGPVALAFPAPTTGWVNNGSCASAQTFLFGTNDGGQHWNSNRTFSASNQSVFPVATAMRFRSPSQGFLINAYTTGSPSSPQFQALQTGNGGGTWQPVSLFARTLQGTVSAMSFLSPQQGWVALRQQSRMVLASTSDGGLHWRVLSGLPLVSPTAGPLVDRVTPSVGYVAAEQGSGTGTPFLWKTINSGASWQVLTLPTLPAGNRSQASVASAAERNPVG